MATLKEIYIFPLKSCRGIRVNRAIITKYGIVHPNDLRILDRKWMIVDKNNIVAIQNQYPKMAQIEIRIVDSDFFELSAQGMEPETIRFPIENPNKTDVVPCNARYWATSLDCYSYGKDSEVSKWLSKFFGNPDFDLVNLNVDLDSPLDKLQNDFNSFMLISNGSLNELNSRLTNRPPVPMINFRPNFIVDGCQQYDEENWDRVKINEIVFQKTKPCVRCILTTTDQKTGERDEEMQPLRVLRTYRLNKDVDETSPMFGVYFKLVDDLNPKTTIKMVEEGMSITKLSS